MNPNLTLRQLRAFDAVAAEGSFTKAANALFLTQSALSVLIREMERELGVTVFDRHTRRVELSAAGHDLHPYVRRILNELNEGVSSITDIRDKKKGELRIAAPQLMACTLMPMVLAVFHQRHPGVEILLQDVLQQDLLERVQSGDVELAIGPDGDLDEAGLRRQAFLKDRHWLVCSQGDPLADKHSLRWQELGDCNFVAPNRDFKARMQKALGVFSDPLLQHPGYETSYFTTAFGLVAAGMGVTLCPTYARPLVNAYGLKMLPVYDPVFFREVCIYSQSIKELSPAAAAFVECLNEVVAASEFEYKDS